ncbi:MAG: hypothetical protein HQM03_08515 [Magnetococcales bacterium]|nr:hypothetical protein [Magnetococcales bacterium]
MDANPIAMTMSPLPVFGLAGSVSAPCDIMHLVVRHSSRPLRYIRSPAPIASGPPTLLHDPQEIAWLTKQGRITALSQEAHCLDTSDSMAFVARPSFLTAYEVLCQETFPWREFQPVAVRTPADAEEERQRFPVLLRGMEERLRATPTQAVIAPVGSLLAMCKQATGRILRRGHATCYNYFNNAEDSPQWFEALDRMKEIGWLAALCAPKPDAANLVIEAYAFTGLSILERQGEESELLKDLFDMGIRPFAPEWSFREFFNDIQNLKITLSVQQTFNNCKIKFNPVIPNKEHSKLSAPKITRIFPLMVVKTNTTPQYREKNESL